MMFGNELMAETLAAYALGYEQSARLERIARTVASGSKVHKGK